MIRQGQVLYRTDNGSGGAAVRARAGLADPVEGTTGEDVTQLNHDLVDLGYADSADISALGWDYYSWETEAAVEALESAAGGLQPVGVARAGSVVFEPEAIRVTSVTGSLGSPASGRSCRRPRTGMW